MCYQYTLVYAGYRATKRITILQKLTNLAITHWLEHTPFSEFTWTLMSIVSPVMMNRNKLAKLVVTYEHDVD